MTILVNTKGSHRAIERFKAAFPNAFYIGRASLNSRSHSYSVDVQHFIDNEEEYRKHVTVDANSKDKLKQARKGPDLFS